MDTGLQQFAEKYNISMQDPHLQLRYTQFHLAEMDYNTDVFDAREGGRRDKAIIIAKNLLKTNLSIEAIASATDLSPEEVTALREPKS